MPTTRDLPELQADTSPAALHAGGLGVGNRFGTPSHRPVRVAGLMGYVDPLGVRPGEVLGVHLSAPAAHEIAVGRLGRRALLLPGPDDAADRAEVTWLAGVSSATADRHDVHLGRTAWPGPAARSLSDGKCPVDDRFRSWND